jgi:ATPase subunit of ABC transporter with duplicated ATPase domains
MIVSHDIYLLQQVCDKTLVFEDSMIRRYEDTFAEFLEKG